MLPKGTTFLTSWIPFKHISRNSNTVPRWLVEKHRTNSLAKAIGAPGVAVDDASTPEKDEKPLDLPYDFRNKYTDFLPDPTFWKRDKLAEKLERTDMIRRRQIVSIPEFYVGSILAVTASDPHSSTKSNRFVGICIQRSGHGLRHCFTLRNIVDGLGVEIMYEMYNPTIQKIEVLKLEKRLDYDLTYLRDSLSEYSTVPFDMKPVQLPPGADVPVNDVKVELKPRPWSQRWERKELKGIKPLNLHPVFEARTKKDAKPWEKWDLMKQYRQSIHEDDQKEIYKDVSRHEHELESSRERVKGSKKLRKGQLNVSTEKNEK